MNTVTFERALLAYMGTRCDVSSQHKLPGREELYETVCLGFLWDRETIDRGVDKLLAEGRLFAYGPYLSDHEINVL